ncbi:MAG TPA: hypothetical protein VMB73_13930 [Acetobacteraceae bacterium]|nr:hypothetical protein [Acetobacteraceae bacterium]
MISDKLTAPSDADSPDADRAGFPMPENIARLLTIVRILLEYGRHLAATIERRATRPGFSLFAALFSTANLPVILAHLNRGILRATALESLLLQRAATGRDVAPSHRTHATPTHAATADNPSQEQFAAQVAHLTAERAQHDAPVDLDNLPTAEQIEAEVHARPIGRTIADICRDLGVVAMMCARSFWDATTDAIACHQDVAAAACLQDTQLEPECFQSQPEQDPAPEQMDRRMNLHPRQTPGFKIGEHTVVPSRPDPAPRRPHQDVPDQHRHAVLAPAATGPPRRAAMKHAA